MENKYIPLASGIDSLDLSFDVQWNNDLFFEYLREMKTIGKEQKQDQAIKFPFTELISLLKPYGRNGYEWIIENDSFTLTVGNWLKPMSRPSIMASIRSIALWEIGAQEIVNDILSLIKTSGGEVLSCKPSRIDLCVDLLVPTSIWNLNLIRHRVTRAAYAAPHFNNSELTGISIGKGQTVARLYNKPLEIQKKSHKYWMYDVWGISTDLPEDHCIIRVESQFRRETIKQVGLDHIDETFAHLEKLWGYFSQDWLKFQDNPGQHHTMRHTLDWWQVVQDSFLGVQSPTPLIRCKSISQRKKQLYAQTSGTLTSILALDHEENDIPLGSTATVADLQEQFSSCAQEYGKSEFELEMDLYTKRAKYQKAKEKMKKVHKQRVEKGLPSNIDMRTCSDKEDE